MTTPKNNSVLQTFAILRAFDERSPEITASEIADKLFPTNGGGAAGVQMSVTFVERIGPRSIVHLEAPGHTACVVGDSQLAAAIGDIAGLATTGRTHLFDAASGERVE